MFYKKPGRYGRKPVVRKKSKPGDVLRKYGLRRIVIRATAKEWDEWKRACKRSGVSVCDMLREMAIRFTEHEKEQRRAQGK